jgi:hypothetical protein
VLKFCGAALIVIASRGLVMAADPILVVNQNLTQTLAASGKTEVSVLISSAREISLKDVVKMVLATVMTVAT